MASLSARGSWVCKDEVPKKNRKYKSKELELVDPSLLVPSNSSGSEIAISTSATAGLRVRAEYVDPNSPAEKERRRLLRIRKRLEFDLITKLDRNKIESRRECWFIMDSRWLNKWGAFVTPAVTHRIREGKIHIRGDDDSSEEEEINDDDDDVEGSHDRTSGVHDDDDVPEPGPVTNLELLAEDKKTPLQNLEPTIDYR